MIMHYSNFDLSASKTAVISRVHIAKSAPSSTVSCPKPLPKAAKKPKVSPAFLLAHARASLARAGLGNFK